MKNFIKYMSLFSGVLAFILIIQCAPSKKPYDLVIKDGLIVDGSGNPWLKGDIGIKNRMIAEIDTITQSQARNDSVRTGEKRGRRH